MRMNEIRITELQRKQKKEEDLQGGHEQNETFKFSKICRPREQIEELQIDYGRMTSGIEVKQPAELETSKVENDTEYHQRSISEDINSYSVITGTTTRISDS